MAERREAARGGVSSARSAVAARGTDTYELNRNLVLTEGAKADSVPNLEIENGNIEGAGHASATGRFDDEQLFYLRARGITEIEARRLVVLGFFNEIVAEIGVDEVEVGVLLVHLLGAQLARVQVGRHHGVKQPHLLVQIDVLE